MRQWSSRSLTKKDSGARMNEMQWAEWSLEYLLKARTAIHEDFGAAMNELRGYGHMHRESWYSSCKNVISNLYHYSAEFVAETEIPNQKFSSPAVFERGLREYQMFVDEMLSEIQCEDEKYQAINKVNGPPFLITIAYRQVLAVKGAVDYVASKKPSLPSPNPVQSDIALVGSLARRFHEAVLSLSQHPHGGEILNINNEWDCQYLFRSILAAYIPDVRDEEWNPSVAGTSARCEFYLKTLRTMVELKYVRKASDQKKIKSELAVDFVDYANNPNVDRLVCLVYDPQHLLKNPAAVRSDLSGAKQGLEMVNVVISPPRD